MNKIFLEFEENFWGNDIANISICHDQRGKNPWFYNACPMLGK